MKLYKNVDLNDLESILTKGILPASIVGDNWSDNKRAKNSLEDVYLFKPLSDLNTFAQYGFVLLEVETEATLNDFEEKDVNKDLYLEFVCDQVLPEEIKAIYIPSILRNIVSEKLNEETLKKVTFVEMKAEVLDSENSTPAIWEGFNLVQEYIPAYRAINNDEMNQWLSTLNGINATEFNYFRGVNEDGTMIDLFNIKYEI